jgi:sulfur transfer complex TusBCD TusB component (DsrH family)
MVTQHIKDSPYSTLSTSTTVKEKLVINQNHIHIALDSKDYLVTINSLKRKASF